jgi:hypothetical protein
MPYLPFPRKKLMRTILVALCICSLLAAGCVNVRPWRVHERPWTPEVVEAASGVRATHSDGTTIVLEDAYLDADATVLHGTRVPASDGAPVAIPTDELALLETRRVEPLRLLANLGLGVVYVIVSLGVLIALSSPPVVMAGGAG